MASSNLNSSNSKFAIDSKYHGLESNVWIELNALNEEIECVNLGQGFPDYQPAAHIVTQLAKVCVPEGNYSFHQYARGYGHPRLVRALASIYGHLIGRSINPMSEVLITGGAYGALFYTIMSNVGKGDEVIIIEPAFDCYEPMVRLAGGKPVFIPLEMEKCEEGKDTQTSESWKLNMSKLASLFNENTKAIVINTPNNPLGKVFSKQELTEIANLCKKFNVLVISDEVYEWIVYDGFEHVRMAAIEGMWERTITIGSAGKTFSLTGWKLGWAYGPANLIRNLQIAHQNCMYMSQTPEQEALGAALEEEFRLLGSPQSYFAQMREELTEKREQMAKAVKAAGFIPIIPQGGYFLLCNWRPLEERAKLSRETDLYPDLRFVKWLAKEKQVLGIPPSAFYSQEHKHLAQDYIRFNFYKKSQTLHKAEELFRQLA